MKLHPFMIRQGEQKHITENYVSVPPALIITDEAGNIWTLGFKMGPITGGEYTFNILCNGMDTHEFANRIERRKGQIWAMTVQGWKHMKVVKQEPIKVYAFGARAGILREPNVPIHVKIYFDQRPDIPIIAFSFNPFNGGLEECTLPILCAPGTWLYAIVEPEDDVTVAGYLGNRNIREIPILKGVKV